MTLLDFDKIRKFKIIVMAGLPGSGKSYLAKKIIQKLGYDYLSSDSIRQNQIHKNQDKYLKDDKEYQNQRQNYYHLLHDKALKAYKKGKGVVIDATNLSSLRQKLIHKLKAIKAQDDCLIISLRTNKKTIENRVKKIQEKSKNKDYYSKWKGAYDFHIGELKSGKSSYPSQKIDYVPVIEIKA